MKVLFQYGDLIILAGLFLSIIMAIAFALKARKQVANIWLSGFLIVGAVVLVVKFLYNTGLIVEHPHWFKVNYPAGLLRPVFLYLYVSFLLKVKEESKIIYSFHFLPFVLLVLYLSPFFIQDSGYKLAVLNSKIVNELGLIPAWYVVFQFLYSYTYLILTYAILRRYVMHNPRLTKKQTSLFRWTRFLVICGLAYLSLAVALRMTDTTGQYGYNLHQVFSILMVLLCIRLLTLPDPISADVASKSYRSSVLTGENITRYFSQINHLMIEDQLYRRRDLKLGDLAAHLDLPEYIISQIINEKTGLTFREYLNGFRISEAKRMLSNSSRHYSIEGTAYDVGFNSRASFYNAFRKATNLTPSQYIKSVG